ncbi:hypothetical protein EROM_041550 [Encephalitozoon romaleae SJ-2008]|uniref:Uncharacterized protein n=1 Tax=Encephalitozoon romaleae (strain SJ-2008) TaxID=1178016 RepID=I7AMI3_ENCRO|nr:hypothetical protein EROM_041550 [Encephalitozoon romaleae SJ-2008]AFN82919.1 hypothetical protein EROM_041550 [Encephalitozoon romaleae SJ-2008]
MELVKGTDYIFCGSRKDIECTLRLPRPIIILTPYKSRCSALICWRDGNDIIMTPRDLSKNLDRMNGGHVVVENCELMEDFGYLPDLIDLRGKNISFILLNAQKAPRFAENPVLLSNSRHFIRAKGDERYAVIFALHKIYKNMWIVCKSVEKMNMFSKIFKLDLTVVKHGDDVKGKGVVVVMDELVNIECEELFYVGEECKGMRPLVLDMSKIGKFLYRIRDVCNMLSPAVIQGKRRLDINRLWNIEK